jgi:uncharacterized phage protein (TIGR01671 family)
MSSDLYLDEDGYPTDLALTLIKEANPFEKNPHDLMDFVKGLWQYTDWGWSEKKKKNYDGKKAILYSISTGGWSGNEDIISALKNNKNFFWTLYWQESRVGGHYKFLIPKKPISKEDEAEIKREEKPSPTMTCGHCGKEMAHNVPRLGDAGGFIHKGTGKFECKISKPTVSPSRLNFRSWDHQTKGFNYFDFRNNMGHLPTDIPNNQINQSTGLLDKNGKEIYEGDIVEFSYRENDHTIFKGRVEHFSDRASFGIVTGNAFTTFDEHLDYMHLLKIIGNIFENPELVTETKI